jgi:hypothetical protein
MSLSAPALLELSLLGLDELGLEVSFGSHPIVSSFCQDHNP